MKLRNKRTGGLANCEPIEVKTDAGFHDYYSLAELCEEWEDYKPKEPLIEDEATAKLVGSWARHWGIEEIRVAVGGGIAELSGWSRTSRVWQEIEILGESISVELEENKCYPIAELCGEEEE